MRSSVVPFDPIMEKMQNSHTLRSFWRPLIEWTARDAGGGCHFNIDGQLSHTLQTILALQSCGAESRRVVVAGRLLGFNELYFFNRKGFTILFWSKEEGEEESTVNNPRAIDRSGDQHIRVSHHSIDGYIVRPDPLQMSCNKSPGRWREDNVNVFLYMSSKLQRFYHSVNEVEDVALLPPSNEPMWIGKVEGGVVSGVTAREPENNLKLVLKIVGRIV